MTVTPQTPCLPDLVPRNFFLFPKLKMALKGRRFNYITRFNVKLQNALAEFQTMHFPNSSNVGTNTGLTA
jgi:hypothetical protein